AMARTSSSLESSRSRKRKLPSATASAPDAATSSAARRARSGSSLCVMRLQLRTGASAEPPEDEPRPRSVRHELDAEPSGGVGSRIVVLRHEGLGVAVAQDLDAELGGNDALLGRAAVLAAVPPTLREGMGRGRRWTWECTAECNLPSGLFATSVKGLALVLLFVFSSDQAGDVVL
ncbi:hypothetical protein MetexDRAFT_6812, partial [Methylorubrum extorquens DSM 13060]